MNCWRTLTVLLLAFLGVACSQSQQAWQEEFFALGTLVQLSIYGVDPAMAEQASVLVEQDFNIMHRDWHAWEPGRLTQFNDQLASLETFTADPALLPLLEDANRLSRLSGGLFNPLIGKLVALWGFHETLLPVGTLPDNAAIKSLLAQAPGVDAIHFDTDRISTENPAVQYDLGAFAKGYAIDRVIRHLHQLGIENAIVNTGGDLRAIGRHGERPWRIGIRHPRRAEILASIEIEGDTSVFTSGDYERFFEVDGKRYHHILDPRTGFPADQATSVTVIHSDAATADAAATALFVAGPEHWVKTARTMGIRYVMLIDSEGVIHMNPAMQQRIQFENDLQPEIRLSEPLS